MNQLFMYDADQALYRSRSLAPISATPGYWPELLTWEQRQSDPSLGIDYMSPQRYLGSVQYGLWLLRPRVLREYQPALDTTHEAYFKVVLDAVDHVWSDPDLIRFWRRGTLVANDAFRDRSTPYLDYGNPFSWPVQFQAYGKPRWFNLSVAYPFNDDKQRGVAGNPLAFNKPWIQPPNITTWSLALQLGGAPNRQWLVYMYATTADITGPLLFTIPGNPPTGFTKGGFTNVLRTGRPSTIHQEGSFLLYTEGRLDPVRTIYFAYTP
jgi:hypothetical protein